MRDREFNEDVSGDWRGDVGKEQKEVRSLDMETRATPREPFPSGSWHRNDSEHQFSSAPSCDYVRRPCTAFPAVPTSASSCRTPYTACGKGIGEVLCLGTLNTLCLKRRSPVDRSNSCSLSRLRLFSSVTLPSRILKFVSFYRFFFFFFDVWLFIARSSNVSVWKCATLNEKGEFKFKEGLREKKVSRHKNI